MWNRQVHEVHAHGLDNSPSANNTKYNVGLCQECTLKEDQEALLFAVCRRSDSLLQVIHSFGVPCELTIVSAHRTPDRMLDYARNAHKRGIKVIVAGAGGAAHLPGMVAALTPLPVVGVPVKPAGAHLDGLDALLSIVQVKKCL